MHSAYAVVFSLVPLLAGACGSDAGVRHADTPRVDTGQATAASGEESLHVIFGCLVGDSAVYLGPALDSAAGEGSAVRITLWHAGDGLDGAIARRVEGAMQSVPLLRLRLAGRDSISLDMPHGVLAADTSAFVGRTDCDSLWGSEHGYRRPQSRRVAYRRSR